MPHKPDSGPPLEELIQAATPEDKPSIHVPSFGSTHIPAKPVMPTWRHKLYWFLRTLIDWIHP